MIPRIEINTDGIRTEIAINGNKVDGVCRFKVEQEAGGIPTLTMDLIATDLTIDGCMCPILPKAFEPFYQLINENGDFMVEDRTVVEDA